MSLKIPRDGVDSDVAVMAMITSRTFTLVCIPPQDPMRIRVWALYEVISSFT